MSDDTCICRRCGENKLAEEFRPKRRVCRECERVDHRNRRRDNIDDRRIREREHYHEHREQNLAAQRRWREANREHNLARYRKYREENPEKRRPTGLAWDQANAEKRRKMARAWQEANRDKVRAINLALYYRRRGGSVVGAPVTPAGIRSRFEYFGHRCWMCGDIADTIDHVKPLSKGGLNILSNIRPACRSCNSSKHARWLGVNQLSEFVKAR